MQPRGRPTETPGKETDAPLTGELIDLRFEEDDGDVRFAPPPPPRSGWLSTRWRWTLGLFLATCLSTLYAQGPAYAAAVMLILLAHEMGHYLQAVRYHVPASLPFFIPMPFTPLGTMGAVIVQGRGVADRKQMFDIAVSGPLAGLIVALPVTYFGLMTSEIKPMPAEQVQDEIVFGMPLVFEWMAEAIHGEIPKGYIIDESPLAFAGWVGIFVTALNLIPIGQLDGGHILYTLIGKRAHKVALALLWGAVAYMIITGNIAYSLLIILLLVMGPRHPPTRDDTVPLGVFRVVVGWLTLAFIIIGFTVTPIASVPG